MKSSYGEIVVYCIEQVGTLVKPTPKCFWKSEGSNLFFLLANLTRFSANKGIRDLLDAVGQVWQIKDTAQVTILMKGLEYYDLKISIEDRNWTTDQAKKDSLIWQNQWELKKKVNPWAPDFKDWRSLYNIVMFGFVKPTTYRNLIEPWALRIIADWRPCPFYINKSKKINYGPIYFVTRLRQSVP